MNQGVRNGNNAGITTLTDKMGNINGAITSLAMSGTTSNFIPGAPNTGYVFQQICPGQSYSFAGQTLTQAGFYTENIAGSAGCDSVTILELAQPTFTNPTITQSAGTLHCEENNASYQWIDCANNTPLAGATFQDLIPQASGSYAVVITIGGCDSTSACVNYLFNGIESANLNASIALYPNPANTSVNITRNTNDKLHVSVLTLDGQEVMNVMSNESTTSLDLSSVAAGTYIVKLSSAKGVAQKKITVAH
jgi:hypothetical protein